MGETIVLGTQRESLLNNPLLVKSEVGKPLKRCYVLPPNDFTYGRPTNCMGNSAAQVLSCWNSRPSQRQHPVKLEKRDFVQLNKAATQSGLVTAEEQTQYRITHDIVEKPDPGFKPLKGPSQSVVYGRPTRPSTPLFDLMEHRYQERWLQEQRQKDLEWKAKEEQKKRATSGKVYTETRSSLLRRHSPPVDPPPLWQMRRFQKVPPALSTFRGQSARRRAFSHHGLDCTSRSGVFGHGVYDGAKS